MMKDKSKREPKGQAGVWLTASEKRRLQIAAALAGESLSVFCRTAALERAAKEYAEKLDILLSEQQTLKTG